MSALKNVFTINYNENETLTNLAARIIKSNNLVAEFEDEEITFKPLQIVAKLISSIAHVPKYNLLLQNIHQMDKTLLTLEKIKNVFLEEDKRIEFSTRNQPKAPKNEVNQIKEKSRQQQQKDSPKQNTDKREVKKHEKDVPCATQGCKGKVDAGKPSNYSKCPKCFVPRQSRDKPKIGNFLVMSTNDAENRSVPGAFYLDSGCTVHVTTGDAEMTKLRKSKVKMSGPSGEIMQSTHTGTIVFPCGDNTIHFCDALIVPTLENKWGTGPGSPA